MTRDDPIELKFGTGKLLTSPDLMMTKVLPQSDVIILWPRPKILPAAHTAKKWGYPDRDEIWYRHAFDIAQHDGNNDITSLWRHFQLSRITRDMCQTAVNHKNLNRKSSLNHLKWRKIILDNNGWWRVTRDMCQTAVKHDGMNRKYGRNSPKWCKMLPYIELYIACGKLW